MTAVPRKYSRLLVKAYPRAITCEKENDRGLTILDQPMSNGEET
jgi:hypothetical protein